MLLSRFASKLTFLCPSDDMKTFYVRWFKRQGRGQPNVGRGKQSGAVTEGEDPSDPSRHPAQKRAELLEVHRRMPIFFSLKSMV